jgi:uncharacterized protein YjbI with pentapeptide repeats
MLPLTTEQIERAWLEPEADRPPPWLEAAGETEPASTTTAGGLSPWVVDEPAAAAARPTEEIPPPESPTIPFPVGMPGPPLPPTSHRPRRRGRWPAIRTVVLGLEALGAAAFAVLAYLDGRYDYLWAALAFGALPIVYGVAAAIRGVGRSRTAGVVVAGALAAILGFSAFTVVTDCGNRLEPGADLSGCDFTDLDLAGLNLTGADLSEATLSGTNLRHANLRDAKLNGANLGGADLADVVFDGADLTNADLRAADLDGSTFSGAVFAGTNLNGLDLDGRDLSGLNLAGADLGSASLANANLQDANLQNAKMANAALDRAQLGGANLAGARLRGVLAQGADLVGADLTGANLEAADLGGATLNEATLTDVNLTGANLDGASLIRTEGLSDAQLADALGVGLEGLGPELSQRAIRLQARADILKVLGPACRGQAVADAAEVAPGGRRLLVLGGASGGASPLSAKPAELKWEPMAARFGQLVACVDQEEAITVEVCQYFVTGSGAPGPPTRRLRYERRVRVVEARTGTVLSDRTHQGSYPGSCPFTKTTFGFGGEDTIEGSHIGFDAFKPQLADHVNA